MGMGGGKGAIHHYVTPVKAGRVILEVGGAAEYKEVYKFPINIFMYLHYILVNKIFLMCIFYS